MTLNDFLNKWKKKYEHTYLNIPIWKDKALEDCYRFFQIMTDEETLVIDYQDEEFCLVGMYDGYLEMNIDEEDAIFLMNKFGFTATKRAKEAMDREGEEI